MNGDLHWHLIFNVVFTRAKKGATQLFFACFQPATQLSFSRPAATLFKYQMHLRPFVRPWACWSEKQCVFRRIVGALLFETTEIDCAIDQLKPGLKSMAQYYFLLVKERVSNMRL